MRGLPALVTALLLPAAQSVLLSAAVSSALLIAQAPAQAQSSEAVGRVAKAITVRVEGATQGSGVIVKRAGNRYTVLTAWHVVSSQDPREELDVYTPDGKRHSVEQGSIQRLGDVDLAVLTFRSSDSYEVARIGEVKSVNSGSSIFVSGFPLPTSAVPQRLYRFLHGRVIANASVAMPNGYQLLYDNQTQQGMSGGAVLNKQGQLVGIHGQGEADIKMSEQHGIAVKTMNNLAVPINYYSQFLYGAPVIASTAQAETADDYIAQAFKIYSKKEILIGEAGFKRDRRKILELANRALELNPSSADAYSLIARARAGMGDFNEGILNANTALSLQPDNWMAYFARANAKSGLGDNQGAISDYSEAIAIEPQYADAYNNRGNAKLDLGDMQGAISDFNKAIEINPRDAAFYSNRGIAHESKRDFESACSDWRTAASLGGAVASDWVREECQSAVSNTSSGQKITTSPIQEIALEVPKLAEKYYASGNIKFVMGDERGAISDFSSAIEIHSQYAHAYKNRGRSKIALGDKKGAIQDFDRAIEIDPLLGDAFFHRSLAKGRHAFGACQDMRQAERLGSSNASNYISEICP